MNKIEATNLVKSTFESNFDEYNYKIFIKNLFQNIIFKETNLNINNQYEEYILSALKIGKCELTNNTIELLIVKTKKVKSLYNAKTMQRNFIANYVNQTNSYGAIVAFVSPNNESWRFSFVKVNYKYDTVENKLKKEISSAKRWSFLAGVKERSNTLQKNIIPLLEKENFSITEFETAFSIEPVTKEFYAEYKKLFDEFNEYSKKNHIKLQHIVQFEDKEKAIRDFNKKLLGRMVFIYFLQKRIFLNIKNNNLNQSINYMFDLFEECEKSKGLFYNEYLEPLFYEVLNTPKDKRNIKYAEKFNDIPFLNGGLFEKEYNEIIYYPNDLFESVFELFNQYNFTIDENDTENIEIAIDPEMLGHIFENLLEDNKEKGAFYTPKVIVDYMTKTSLIEYLKNNFEEKYHEKIEIFIKYPNETNEIKSFIDENKDKLNNLLDKVKILDPAIGSGAFPVSILLNILKIKETLNPDLDRAETKRKIIENSIYGVDIEQGAVDIARLRFWLSLIIDENDIKPLPNLDYKIVCGDSLLTKFEEEVIDIDLSFIVDKKTDLIKLSKELEDNIIYYNNYFSQKQSEKTKNQGMKKITADKINNINITEQNTINDKEFLIFFEKNVKYFFCDESNINSITSKILDKNMKDKLKDLFEVYEKNNKIMQEIKELSLLFHSYFNKTNENKNKLKHKIKLNKIKILEILFKDKISSIDKKIKSLVKNLKRDNYEIVNKKNDELLKTEKLNYEKNLNKLESIKNSDKALYFFDNNIDFYDVMKDGGFDIVIGNPPYVFTRDGKISENEKNIYYLKYDLAKYQINLYILFIEQSDKLLKTNGLLSFIIPNNWLTINTNKEMRKFILNKSNINIINFYEKVFENANVDNTILFFNKSEMNKNVYLFEYKNDFNFVKKINSDYFLKQRDYIININLLKNINISNLIDIIEKKSVLLKDIADVKAGLKAYEVGKATPMQTNEMKINRVYHSKEKIDESYYKYLDGSDVCRYYHKWSKEYLKYGINLAAPRINFNLFSSKRILVRQIPSKLPYCLNACYIEDTYLNDLNSMNIINAKIDYKYILSILNSKLISFWFANKFGKLQRGIFPQFKINELENFPIPLLSEAEQLPFINLVDQILSAKKENPAADTKDLEKQIDKMVYKLYGLTKEEIEIVEGK